MNDHESLLAEFLLKSKRERYKGFLASPKGRKKFVAELGHFKHLDPAACKLIASTQQNPAQIALLLKKAGAPEPCWVISENREIDAKQLSLIKALEEVVGSGMGSFLSCIPGKVGYFEDEEERFLLIR